MFKLKTAIRRFINSVLGYNRPGSYPYISGDTFRSLAHHIHDEFYAIDPKKVHAGDIVFIKSNFIQEFFAVYAPRIRNPFFVITHNSDIEIDSYYEQYTEGHVIHWFAQNCTTNHPKFTPLPIGLENRIHNKCRLYSGEFSSIISQHKPHLTLMALNTVNIHPERQQAINICNKIPWIDSIKMLPTKDAYYEKIVQYKFVISPRGAGIDCHRTWEALCLGTIPIVIKNNIHEYFYRSGVPLFMVEHWDDLTSITEETLEKFYNEHISWFNNPSIMVPYWIAQINNKKSASKQS